MTDIYKKLRISLTELSAGIYISYLTLLGLVNLCPQILDLFAVGLGCLTL